MADHNGSTDVHPVAGRTGAGGATEDCNGQNSSTKLPILDISAAQGAAGMAAAVALIATDGAAEPPSPGSPTDRRQSKHKSADTQKLGHRRVKEGEVTYKKIETSTIMGAIQLGIAYAVGAEASKPKRDVLLNDFYTVETIDFPRQGGQFTPAHHYYDFRLKIYATVGFKYFRALFGIRPDDFLVSMCHSPLRELTNAGASGSIFYLSHDDEFIMKTVQHKEGDLLQKLLPGYFMNLNQNPRTLLPKFFGLYCYNCNSKNIRLVVMNNLLPSSIKMHQRYDLKGSTYKRKANKHERAKKSPTFKDLDFLEQHPEGLMLEAPTYTALMQTIQNDCRVLESFMIMDYSLLIGVYNLDLAAKEKAENIDNVEEAVPGTEGSGGLARTRSINRQRLVAHSTAMESIQAESEPIDEQHDVPPGGIPARNSKGERLLLFLGIIDILQSYRFGKRLEHTLKAMVHDGNTISVHRPDFYSKRFFDFMGKHVFQKIASLDGITGHHRKFRSIVSSYIALRHSPSKRKSQSLRTRVLDGERRDTGESTAVAVDSRQPRISVRTYPTSQSSDTVIETESGAAAGTATAAAVGFQQPPHPDTLPSVLQDRPPPSPVVPDAPVAVRFPAAGGGVSGGEGLPQAPPHPDTLPSVLQDRSCPAPAPSPPRAARGGVRQPPPVPPRSPRVPIPWMPRPHRPSASMSATAGIGLSTQVATRSSSERHVTQVTIRHDSGGSTEIGDRLDAVSISDIRLESGGGRRSRSTLSVDSGSAGGGVAAPTVGDPTRHLRHVTWTPPMSVEGSTPTWTEGTPSFTESSSSGDMGCPTTPARVVTSELGSRDRSATGNGHRGPAAASCTAVPSPRTYRETEMVDRTDTALPQEQSTCVRVLHSSDAPP